MSDEIFSMDDVDLDEVCEADKICEDSRILVMDDLVGHKIYLFREKETVDVLPRSLKSYSLALPGAEGGKVKYIPIRVLEAKGNIYVSENIYNANANRFITNLGDAYGRKENEVLPPEMPFDSIKKYFDLSLCKTPYRKAYFTKDHKVAFKSIAPSAEDIKDRSRFDSIMANPKIRYIYSSKENSIHDKSCSRVSNIPYKFIIGSEELPEGHTFCKKCHRNLLIRKGCGSDFKNVDLYLKFFNDGFVSIEVLERLVVDNNAKLLMDGPNSLKVKCREDSWIITHSNGKYRLFHNNYSVLDDGSRYIPINMEYHTQGNYDTLKRALTEIEGYSWEGHLAYKAEQERIKELELKKQNSLWNRFKKWLLGFRQYFRIKSGNPR